MASNHKTFTFADVCKHNKPKDCWIIISGKVYDVTPFMKDHPGGDEELLKATGKDATNDFEDISHSDEAKKIMKKYYVGKIDESTIPTKPIVLKPSNIQSPADKIKIPSTTVKINNSNKNPQFITKILQFLAPLVILGLVYTIRAYTKEKSA